MFRLSAYSLCRRNVILEGQPNPTVKAALTTGILSFQPERYTDKVVHGDGCTACHLCTYVVVIVADCWKIQINRLENAEKFEKLLLNWFFFF